MQNNIKRGDRVVDKDGHEGIVVKIEEGYDIEEHGTITVWQLNRNDYGLNNCEHYPYFNWQNNLIIVLENT